MLARPVNSGALAVAYLVAWAIAIALLLSASPALAQEGDAGVIETADAGGDAGAFETSDARADTGPVESPDAAADAAALAPLDVNVYGHRAQEHLAASDSTTGQAELAHVRGPVGARDRSRKLAVRRDALPLGPIDHRGDLRVRRWGGAIEDRHVRAVRGRPSTSASSDVLSMTKAFATSLRAPGSALSPRKIVSLSYPPGVDR